MIAKGFICPCGNKILYNPKKCPHCGRINGEYIRLGRHLVLEIAKYYGLSLVTLDNRRLVYPIIRLFRSLRSPERCKHKYRQRSCWCRKCGRLRPGGHDWRYNENGSKCMNCWAVRDKDGNWDECNNFRHDRRLDHDWALIETYYDENDPDGLLKVSYQCRKCGRRRGASRK